MADDHILHFGTHHVSAWNISYLQHFTQELPSNAFYCSILEIHDILPDWTSNYPVQSSSETARFIVPVRYINGARLSLTFDILLLFPKPYLSTIHRLSLSSVIAQGQCHSDSSQWLRAASHPVSSTEHHCSTATSSQWMTMSPPRVSVHGSGAPTNSHWLPRYQGQGTRRPATNGWLKPSCSDGHNPRSHNFELSCTSQARSQGRMPSQVMVIQRILDTALPVKILLQLFSSLLNFLQPVRQQAASYTVSRIFLNILARRTSSTTCNAFNCAQIRQSVSNSRRRRTKSD